MPLAHLLLYFSCQAFWRQIWCRRRCQVDRKICNVYVPLFFLKLVLLVLRVLCLDVFKVCPKDYRYLVGANLMACLMILAVLYCDFARCSIFMCLVSANSNNIGHRRTYAFFYSWLCLMIHRSLFLFLLVLLMDWYICICTLDAEILVANPCTRQVKQLPQIHSDFVSLYIGPCVVVLVTIHP